MTPRHLVAVASLVGSAVVPAVLMLTPALGATQAEPLCESVTVTTTKFAPLTVSRCQNYNGAVICDSGEQGLNPSVMVYDTVCLPAIVAQEI